MSSDYVRAAGPGPHTYIVSMIVGSIPEIPYVTKPLFAYKSLSFVSPDRWVTVPNEAGDHRAASELPMLAEGGSLETPLREAPTSITACTVWGSSD